MTWMPTGWDVLGQRVLAVRTRRWRTRNEFAAACGLSSRLLDDLENGRRTRYQPATLAAVETALGWEAGSCLRIVEGGQPVPEMDPLLLRMLDAWMYLTPSARELLLGFAESAPPELRRKD